MGLKRYSSDFWRAKRFPFESRADVPDEEGKSAKQERTAESRSGTRESNAAETIPERKK